MIRIYTFAFNNPEFLEKQHACFKKFMKQDHELICINNASDRMHWQRILDKAHNLHIKHYTPEGVSHAKAGTSHQQALNWAWNNLIKHEDIVIIVDHDMFPVREFQLYEGYDIASVMQGRGEHIKYFHPGIMIIHPSAPDRDRFDFTGTYIDGLACDSGGNMHHYLQQHPEIKIKELSMVNVSSEQGNLDVIPPVENYNEENPMQICEDFLLHFRAGSNWCHDPADVFNRKKLHLEQTLNHYMK